SYTGHVEGELYDRRVSSLEQALKIGPREPERRDVRDGPAGGHGPNLAKQLDLAKQGGAVELRQSALRTIGRRLDDDYFPARCDVERGRAGFALQDDDFVRFIAAGLHEIDQGHEVVHGDALEVGELEQIDMRHTCILTLNGGSGNFQPKARFAV